MSLVYCVIQLTGNCSESLDGCLQSPLIDKAERIKVCPKHVICSRDFSMSYSLMKSATSMSCGENSLLDIGPEIYPWQISGY